MKWSKGDIDLLAAMWRASDKLSAMAQHLGRSEWSVSRQAMRQGLEPRRRLRKFGREEDAAIRREWAAKSLKQLAADHGRSVDSIWKRGRKLGLPSRR